MRRGPPSRCGVGGVDANEPDHLEKPRTERRRCERVPFDQFTREQLAGDLLESATKWQKVASGYNRLLQTSHEGGIQEKEYNAIYAADRVRNLSEVWMGATLGCAQCHDHKYDPYTTKDFYSMAAFLQTLKKKQLDDETQEWPLLQANTKKG